MAEIPSALDESILDELPEFDPQLSNAELQFALDAYIDILELLPPGIRGTAASRALMIWMYLHPQPNKMKSGGSNIIAVMAKHLDIG